MGAGYLRSTRLCGTRRSGRCDRSAKIAKRQSLAKNTLRGWRHIRLNVQLGHTPIGPSAQEWANLGNIDKNHDGCSVTYPANTAPRRHCEPRYYAEQRKFYASTTGLFCRRRSNRTRKQTEQLHARFGQRWTPITRWRSDTPPSSWWLGVQRPAEIRRTINGANSEC